MLPPFPPANDLVFLALTECLFGIAYNQAVKWFGSKHGRLFKFLVSWSVVFGVAGTLTIRLIYFWGWTLAEWQTFLIDLLCFAGSGLPMIVGSMARGAKRSHKAMKLPTHAQALMDDVAAEMSRLANDVNEKAQAGEVKAATLIEIVHRLHQWMGMLRSL